MITLDAFARRCAGLVKDQVSFTAYLHDSGHGLLILDKVSATRYTIDRQAYNKATRRTGLERITTLKEAYKDKLVNAGASLVKTEAVHQTVKPSIAKAFAKAVAKMRKDRRTRFNLTTIDYDGFSCVIDGANADRLTELLNEQVKGVTP